MNFASTFAAVTAVLAMLMAVLAWSLSRIPGWRGLRWFSGISLGALCFAVGNCVATLPVPDAVILSACQLGLWGAALFLFSAPAFCAHLERRAPSRVDHLFMALAVVSAVLVAIPGAVFGQGVEHRIIDAGWFGAVAYREPTNGPLEGAFLIYFGASTGWYALELLAASRRLPGVIGHGVAMLLVALGILNDVLVSRGVIEGTYLVLVALQAMIVASGTLISRRLGQGARELARLTRELELTEAALVRRERLAALGAVAAGVSGQVRAPLEVLERAVQSLRARLGDHPDTGELLSISAEESGRIGRIVSELSDFASPRAPTFAEHPLEEVLSNAVRAALLGARLTDDAVQLHLATGRRTLWCDAGLLHQSLVNLVNNALQARGRSGPVELHVRWEDAPARAVIEVRDDGVGLAPELHQQIFEPFFTTRATGAGLGLSLVRRVAEAHGGQVTVTSRPGAGACFILTLPLHPSPGGDARAGGAGGLRVAG